MYELTEEEVRTARGGSVKPGEAKRTIRNLGDKLGYVTFCEIEARPGTKVDAVWLDKSYKRMYGGATPKLREALYFVKVAFEIENNYSSKQLKGDIYNLQCSGAALGVIVIPPSSELEKNLARPSQTRKGGVWTSCESIADVLKVIRRDTDSPSSRIVVLPLDELVKLDAKLGRDDAA